MCPPACDEYGNTCVYDLSLAALPAWVIPRKTATHVQYPYFQTRPCSAPDARRDHLQAFVTRQTQRGEEFSVSCQENINAWERRFCSVEQTVRARHAALTAWQQQDDDYQGRALPRRHPGELRSPVIPPMFAPPSARPITYPQYMRKCLDDAADLFSDHWPQPGNQQPQVDEDHVQDDWEDEGWYSYCDGFLGTRRVHVPGRPDHQLADLCLISAEMYYSVALTATRAWSVPLSFRVNEGMLPPTLTLWVHETDYAWMRCYKHRGMRPTDAYTPSSKGMYLPNLKLGTADGTGVIVSARVVHTVMDLKFLLQAQNGTPLHSQTILVTWPSPMELETATAQVVKRVASPLRDSGMDKLRPLQRLVVEVTAALNFPHDPGISNGDAVDIPDTPTACTAALASAARTATTASTWAWHVVSTSVRICQRSLLQQVEKKHQALQQRIARWKTEVLGRLEALRGEATELAPGTMSAGSLLFALNTTLVVDANPRVLSYIGWDLGMYSERARCLGLSPSKQHFWDMQFTYDHWHTEQGVSLLHGRGVDNNTHSMPATRPGKSRESYKGRWVTEGDDTDANQSVGHDKSRKRGPGGAELSSDTCA